MGHSWDFTLPTLDGSRFVQASALSGPVLVNFWGRDCEPCVSGLPRLQAFAKAHPQWTVLLISTDPPAAAAELVQSHGVTLTVLRPGANVAALMRRAGSGHGGLPFTVGLIANRREARICGGQAGELAAADLGRIQTACAANTPP